MIVRDARRAVTDYGPTPALHHGVPGGTLARPASGKSWHPPTREQQSYINEWKRRKRREDPEWAERERAYDRERQRGRVRAA